MNNGWACNTAIGCPGGGACRRITCIDPGPPAAPESVAGCIMRCCRMPTDSEICHIGNHDPNIDTEQSQCQADLSCWEQLALEWPSVILEPPGAPDPGPASAPTTVVFLTPSVLDRFVAVIDRSGSMSTETPARIDVAVSATRDFVDFLNDGTDFGLASFASADGSPDPPGEDSTKDFPAVAGLRALNTAADRDDARTAISGLSTRTGGWTRIGAGLREARDMLLEAGGTITLNTTVLLLTDGLNNRPEDDPQADLDAALTEMADAGIPVFITCIGEARDSEQCSYIADRTSGRFVDSAETESLYDAFVEFAAMAQGQEITMADTGVPIGQGAESAPIPALIEPGAGLARFVVTWTKPSTDLDLNLYHPNGVQEPVGNKIQGSQGEFYFITNPESGTWTMRVFGASVNESEKFSARAIVENKELNVAAGLAKAAIRWPETFHISARPSMGLTIKGCQVTATANQPGGGSDTFELKDDGTGADTLPGDGLYQARYGDFIE